MVGAIIGAIGGVASAAYSFYQADQESKAAAAAQKEQARLRKDARSRAEINYFEGLTLPMEAYEQAFENTLASTQTQVEALQEADPRALAAGIGRVGAIATQRDAQTRTTMAEDLFKLDKMKAQSRDAINQQLFAMDIAEKREMAKRERDAERLKAQQVQAGITGATAAAQSIDALIPLFTASGTDKRAMELAEMYKDTPGLKGKTMDEIVEIMTPYAKDKAKYKSFKSRSPEDFSFKDNEFIFKYMDPSNTNNLDNVIAIPDNDTITLSDEVINNPGYGLGLTPETGFTGMTTDTLDYFTKNPGGTMMSLLSPFSGLDDEFNIRD